MSDTDNNGSNGSSDNNNNNQSNETNNPVSTPGVETPKQEDNKPTENPAPTPEPVKDELAKVEDKPTEPTEPTKDEGVNYTPPKAEDNNTDNTSVTNNVVAFSISGSTNLSGKVPKGMNVKDAITKLGGNASGYSFRDSNNKMIYGTHIINEDIKLTASTRASGG